MSYQDVGVAYTFALSSFPLRLKPLTLNIQPGVANALLQGMRAIYGYNRIGASSLMSKGLRQFDAPVSPAGHPEPTRQVEPLFDVVLTGYGVPTVPLNHAAIQLARLLRISPTDAHTLLGGRSRIVRARLSLAPALRYQAALQRVGAECQIVRAPTNMPQHSNATAARAERRPGVSPIPEPQPSPHAARHASCPKAARATLPPKSGGTPPSAPEWWMPESTPARAPTLTGEGLAAVTAVWGMSWTLLIYGAAIVILAGGLMWHTWQHADWLSSGVSYLFPVSYIGFLLGGIAILLVLLRPLLAVPCDAADGLDLDGEQAPVLYDLVHRVANAVGSPIPAGIRLTWHTTVRMISGAQADGPMLIVGLPVLAALSLEELTVTLVHALAPFSTARRSPLHRATSEIESFLQHAACGPDNWDRFIETHLISSRDGPALALLFIASLLRASRAVFLPGLALARFAARRVQANEAVKRDALAARFTGESAVSSASSKLRLLRNAEVLTSQAAINLGVQEQPVRDLPGLTVERAVRSERLKRPEQPASTLVPDFAALSIAATQAFYAAAGALRHEDSRHPGRADPAAFTP